MSFFTCFWLLPQNEHFSRSPPSPMRATGGHPPIRPNSTAGAGSPAGTTGGAVGLRCWGCPSVRAANPSTVPRAAPRRGDGHGTRRGDVASSGQDRGLLARVEHRVDQAVLDGRLGGEDLVALDVVADLLNGLAAVVADHPLQQLAHPQD